jgi:hypothetical protein
MATFDDVPVVAWFDYIKQTPDKPWNYDSLSQNPNITWDAVAANPDKAWDYDNLSWNPSITLDVVSANPDKPWNYNNLSSNLMSKHPFFQSGLSSFLR